VSGNLPVRLGDGRLDRKRRTGSPQRIHQISNKAVIPERPRLHIPDRSPIGFRFLTYPHASDPSPPPSASQPI